MHQYVEPKDTIDVDGVVKREDGGTSADNAPQAAKNLGMVLKTQVGKLRGPIPIDAATGKIPYSYFQGLASYRVEVDGPEVVVRGSVNQYRITNFDSRISYAVQATNGSIARQRDIISYTAPLDRSLTPGFIVNGESWPLAMRPNTPIDPYFVQDNLLDKKMFTLRASSDGPLAIAVNGDFNKLIVGDPMATVENAKKAGQVETYSIANNLLSKASSRQLTAQAFSVLPILGEQGGSYQASSDAVGWVANSSVTDVAAGSTFFEATIKGGAKWSYTYTAGGNSSFLNDYYMLNHGVKLSYDSLFGGSDNVAIWAGVDLPPVSISVDGGKKELYLPMRTRLAVGTTTIKGSLLTKISDTLTNLDTVDVALTVSWRENAVAWSAAGFTGSVIGTWGEESTQETTVTLPGTDTFLKIGNAVLRAKGQGVGDTAPASTTFQALTRENVMFGQKVAIARFNDSIVYSVSQGPGNYQGISEFMEIQTASTRLVVNNPSGKTAQTGFGCFVSTSDAGSVVLVGESKASGGKAHVFSSAGSLTATFNPGVANASFGYDGDLSSDALMAVISAPDEARGVLYVYSVTNPQAAPVKIQNPLSNQAMRMGYRVKLSRDKMKIFVTAKDANGNSCVVVFKINGQVWEHLTTLTPIAGVVGFGTDISVSDSGRVALIGAPGNDTIDGVAQVWFEGDLEWEYSHSLNPKEAVTNGRYGNQVVLSGDGRSAIVSAPGIQTSSTSYGRIYYFK